MKHTGFSVKKAVFLCLSFVFLCILIVVGCFEKGQKLEYKSTVIEGWQYRTIKEDHILQASHPVTEEMDGKTISFYATDSYVDAGIDGQMIYHFGKKPLVGHSPGSYYHFIEIPEHMAGKELSITIQTVYPHKFSSEYQFRLGSTGDLVLSYLNRESFNIIANFVILMFGILMCLLHFFQNRMKIRGGKNLYFGLMSITFVLWSDCVLFVNQILIESAVFQYYLNYFALYLLFLVLILYIEALDKTIHCRLEFFIEAVTVCILVILHFTGIRDFTETMQVFSVIIGVDMVILMIHIITHMKKNRKVENALLILLGFAILNTLDYILQTRHVEHYTMLTKIGLLIYMLISVYYGMQDILDEIVLAKESLLLKKIAYMDNLTKRSNRYALERDLQEKTLSSLSIVSMDLNNLKICNDRYGHVEGDKFIKGAADILYEIYPNIYRVGGDEFVALLENASKENLEEKKHLMQRKVAQYNKKHGTNAVLEIASGYSSYQEGDVSYEDILKRADREMYCDKKHLKENAENEGNGEK